MTPGSPDGAFGLVQVIDWARDWVTPLFGAGFLLWVWRAASWKRDVETTQESHSRRIVALEIADIARAESHNKLEVAVAALPRRDEVRDMINDLREGITSSLHAARVDRHKIAGDV